VVDSYVEADQAEVGPIGPRDGKENGKAGVCLPLRRGHAGRDSFLLVPPQGFEPWSRA
jgi:hypothetical protein